MNKIFGIWIFCHMLRTVLTLIWCFEWQLFQTVLHCVALQCRTQHMYTHPLSCLYLDNWDQSNTAIAWCHCWLQLLNKILLCWATLTNSVQFIQKWEIPFLLVIILDLFHAWKSLCVHLTKCWLCSKMYSTCSWSICLVWLYAVVVTLVNHAILCKTSYIFYLIMAFAIPLAKGWICVVRLLLGVIIDIYIHHHIQNFLSILINNFCFFLKGSCLIESL